MFTAKTADGVKIPIEDAIPGGDYLCPVCDNPVIVKAKSSVNVCTHFAHKAKTFCLDDWHHDMSDWHFEWQSKFPIENREVIVRRGDIVHRADILINNTVIEFQHSPISGKEFDERNQFYKSCGYSVVWLFDGTGKMKLDGGYLIWKRRTTLFSDMKVPIDAFYVQQFLPEQGDEIISLTKLDSKLVERFRTSVPIKPENFLKEYGAIQDENVLSIRDIFKETNRIHAENRRKAERDRARRVDAAFGKILSSGCRRYRRF